MPSKSQGAQALARPWIALPGEGRSGLTKQNINANAPYLLVFISLEQKA
jgi:hypothetical protein